MVSHMYGDCPEWPYFGDVDNAASYIGRFCRKWGRISVTQTKEKYGTARVYCNIGISQLHDITHPGYVRSRYPHWLWHIDVMYVSKLSRFLRVNKVVVPYQKYVYRLAYRNALKRWPHIREEILAGADWPELLEGL